MIVSTALVVEIGVTVALIVAAQHLPALPIELDLRSGHGVTALRAGPEGPTFTLDAIDTIEEPDVAGSWDDLHDFYARQAVIWRLLQSESVEVEVGGAWRRVPITRRGLGELPLAFYTLLGAALVAWVVGFFTYAFSDRGEPARIYTFSAVAFALAVWPAALYSTRPLALEAQAFRWLSTLDHVGGLFFASGLLALVATYPVRLTRSIAWLWILTAVAGIAGHLELGPMWLSGFYTANFVQFALFLGLSYWQWRAARTQPLQRAALGWIMLSIFVGVIFFAALITVPVLWGSGPLITQTTGLVMIVCVYAGISLGVLRFRLFDLDRWWLRTWSWVLSGLVVIAADLVLTRLFDMSQPAALVIALVVAGWIYFPIRQRLFERVAGLASSVVFDPRTLIAASSIDDLRGRFRDALAATFAPLEIAVSDAPTPAPRLASDGVWLEVPSPVGDGTYRCRLRNNGTRLFSREDLTRASDLVALAESVRSAITAREEGELAERARIRRDLHDDLGASIIRIAHEASDEHTAELAKSAMRDLRDVLTALHDQPTPCLELLEDLEAELRARAVAQGRELTWRVEGTSARVLPARRCANLTRVLRESLTNALRHGTGAVCYEIALDASELRITTSNAMADGPTEAGLGLANITSRMKELGGAARHRAEDGHFTLELRLPWDAEA